MSLLSGLKFIPRDQINEEEEENSDVPHENRKSKRRKEKRKKKSRSRYSSSSSSEEDTEKKGKQKVESNSTERTEAGLGWMLRPKESEERKPVIADDSKPVEPVAEEVVKENPRELNPYLKYNGSGYPEEDDNNSGGNKLLSSSIVGDGGASWRLKALKRAQEQAAREGRSVDEIVGERWGSVSELAASETSRVAPARAHLHAIHKRRRGNNEEFEIVADKGYERNSEKHVKRDYLKDVSSRHPEMKAPKVHDSLSWGKQRSQGTTKTKRDVSEVSPGVLSASAKIEMPLKKENNLCISSLSGSSKASANRQEENLRELDLSEHCSKVEDNEVVKSGLSSNQLAAKALQLRMKGRHKEAEELMKEAENMKVRHEPVAEPSRSHYEGSSSRYVMESKSANRKKDEDADRLLAQNIARNKQFSVHGQADDEYDFDDGPRKKSRKKGSTDDSKRTETTSFTRRILTQQERCQFCFENPKRPKHLVISVANFTYLMLPQSQPVVPGHCCILPMQHEASTRSVDNNVWEELRNFKKCLIMMFAEQEKDVLFLETVMGLAQQKRHCLIECIPLPQDIARDAPLYFKKAIDEAEDEWSQHNAKKLIDTSVKGLRGSIPKDFPYFHVEFGLNKGFVHVIDDETQFKSSFGLNVIRGMLELAEEDMYRKRRHESFDAQRKAVTSFVQDWDRFDWTKQL